MARLKDLLNEETLNKINENVLGELPSARLKKMKWNPITESEPVTEDTPSINETKYTIILPNGQIGAAGIPRVQASQALRAGGRFRGAYMLPDGKKAAKFQKAILHKKLKGSKLDDLYWDLREIKDKNINELNSRMMSLVNNKDKRTLADVIQNYVFEFADDGFDEQDIQKYMAEVVKSYVRSYYRQATR